MTFTFTVAATAARSTTDSDGTDNKISSVGDEFSAFCLPAFLFLHFNFEINMNYRFLHFRGFESVHCKFIQDFLFFRFRPDVTGGVPVPV